MGGSHRLAAVAAFALLVLMPSAAGFEPARDVADEAGVAFTHAGFHGGPESNRSGYYEETAGGACWADYDADGRLDLYVTDFLGPDLEGRSRLFRNLGPDAAGAWRFEDASATTGTSLRGVAQGCAWGDFDNDGWPDLYVTFVVTHYSTQRNVLFRNLGDGRGFEDVTARAGVTGDATGESGEPCFPTFDRDDGSSVNRCWSVGAAWLDYDLDGDLDIYVANYAEFPWGNCDQEFNGNPVLCNGQPNRLYRNDGDGTFADVAAEAGVAFNGQPTRGRSLAVVASDLDGDAWPDLYVANDKDANALYLNNRDGSFRSVAAAMGVDNHGPKVDGTVLHRAGMGVDAQDFDNDGLVDLASTHLKAEIDGIYRNTGNGWDDVARELGFGDEVALDESRWGIGFVDFDLDGSRDVLVVAGDQARTNPGPVHLLLQRDGRFEWQGEDAWAVGAERANHRSAAFADYDNDGDVDVYVSTLPNWHGAPIDGKLLRFDYAGENPAALHAENPALGRRSLSVELEGTDGARDPVGAKVTVTLEDGRRLVAWRTSGGSYAGSNDARLHFGLGDATRGSVQVVWPGGAEGAPVPFELGDDRRAALRIEEENRHAPAAVAWADAAATRHADGSVTIEWRPSVASDFAKYVVLQGERPGSRARGAHAHEVAERDATSLTLPDLSGGGVFRVLVVDAAGHASEGAPDLDVAGTGARTSAPAALLAVLATLAVALWRRRA